MGGGGSKSKNITTQSTNIFNEVISRNISNHSMLVQQEQSIDISGDYNIVDGIKMTQAFMINVNEVTDQAQIAQMRNDITTALQQQAASQSVALFDVFGGGTEAENNVTIATEVSSLITVENIRNVAVNVNQAQFIDISGDHNIIKHVTMDQFGTIIYENVLQLTQTSALITQMDITLAQTAEATSESPLQVIVDAIAAIGDVFGVGIWVVVLVGVVALIVVLKYNPMAMLKKIVLAPSQPSTVPG